MADPDTSLFAAVRQVFDHVPRERRRQAGPLVALMLLGAIAEVATLGAILPFLALLSGSLTGSSPAHAPSMFAPVLAALPADPTARVAMLTAIFVVAAVVAAAIRLRLLWSSEVFVYGLAYDLTVEIYRRTLYQPYAYHASHNSSAILASINKAQIVTNEVLLPLMFAVSSALIAVFIVVGLLLIDPVIALVAGVGFGAIYLVVMRFTRAIMRRNSVAIAAAQAERLQLMTEGLGGIRDVLLDRSQPHFLARFAVAEARSGEARGVNSFLAGAPRFLVEAAGMILIALVAVLLSGRPGGLVASIPVLGALALGSQRLLPLLQLIYSGWSRATGSHRVLQDLLGLLSLNVPGDAVAPLGAALPFSQHIELAGVSFRYADDLPKVLADVSIRIGKGQRVGFIGKTGSGKSTLIDLVLGLLEPTEGSILVDSLALTSANRGAWQRRIAHVPQAIYLADASVAENVAFGVSGADIDRDRVRRVLEQAELADVIAALPAGMDTGVGERGVRLSGGQRQRLGIARALYKQADILVFDEATSALDTGTEAAVMQAIKTLSRDLTILIIAHRLSTLEECDLIVRLDDGKATISAHNRGGGGGLMQKDPQ